MRPRITIAPRLRWAALLWTLLGTLATALTFVSYLWTGTRLSLPDAMAWGFVEWYAWGLLSVPIARIARRRPIERGTIAPAVLLHAFLSLLFPVVHFVLATAVIRLLPVPQVRQPWAAALLLFAGRRMTGGIVVYWTIVGAVHLADYDRRYRERELRAAQLESQLATARLEALRMQLRPHFLFNTLHAVSALIHRSPDVADRMVVRLGDFLRMTLQEEVRETVPLRSELQFLDTYLDIERIRFQDRLTVRSEIDPQLLDVPVPTMVLQPVVENAIRHGIDARPGGGTLSVTARRDGTALLIVVRDDGVGFAAAPAAQGQGIGLANTRERLQRLYGERQELSIRSTPTGTDVTLRIPFPEERPRAR